MTDRASETAAATSARPQRTPVAPPVGPDVAASEASIGLLGVGSFDAFYRHEFPSLVALARAVSGSAAAEDLAQEAMLVVFGRWQEVSGMEQPAIWARRVCLNLSRSDGMR